MQPNFLIFITDQHRAYHLGCYGNPTVRTPHIDALAQSGSRFDRDYVANPVSMPNRGPIMTGLLADANTYVYVCGLKAMEEGVVMALRDVVSQSGGDWSTMHQTMKSEGRIHFETY